MKTRAGYVPLLLLLCSGCFDSLVGEECAEGYQLCGEICLPAPNCSLPDAGWEDSGDALSREDSADARGDAGEDGLVDVAIEPTPDAPQSDTVEAGGGDVPVDVAPWEGDTGAPDLPIPPTDTANTTGPDTQPDVPVVQPDTAPPDTIPPDTAPLDMAPPDTPPLLDTQSDQSMDSWEVADDTLSGDGLEVGVALTDAGDAEAEAGLDAEADAALDSSVDQAIDTLVVLPDALVDLIPDVSADTLSCPIDQVACGAVCVNTATDPDNCGTCGTPCANGLCSNGQCESQGTGRLIVIGHDYFEPRPAMNRVLGNAVFLWPTNPVRLLVYEGKGNSIAIAGAEAAIAQVAAATGRQYTKTIAMGSGVPVALSNTDVFLIHAQETATDTELLELGSQWSSALTTFVTNGGTLVVLDAVYAVNNGTTQLLEAPGLFSATARTSVTGEICTVIALGDAVSTGLYRTYLCEPHSVGYTTAEETQVITATSNAAVVIHKVF